eukprot:scaffold5297_cov374-Prasinococcus_capsulatus_cf.AAC.8
MPRERQTHRQEPLSLSQARITQLSSAGYMWPHSAPSPTVAEVYGAIQEPSDKGHQDTDSDRTEEDQTEETDSREHGGKLEVLAVKLEKDAIENQCYGIIEHRFTKYQVV